MLLDMCRAAAAMQRMIGSVTASSPTDATSVAYWAYHSARNMFMAAQGVTSVAFSDLTKSIRCGREAPCTA